MSYTIGKLAKESGVNIQTIRFYERQGILEPVLRKESGYRIYDMEGLRQLTFILHAKELGFSLKEIKELLELRIDSVKHCGTVKEKITEKLSGVKYKISQLRKLEKTLKQLVQDCDNRVVSEGCPVISSIEK